MVEIHSSDSNSSHRSHNVNKPVRIIAVSLLIGMYGMSLIQSTNSKIDTSARTSSSKSVTSPTSLSCEMKLDMLDNIYDKKRFERQKWINGYVKLIGRIPSHDEPPALNENNYWDMYEPESTCINEERFGSNINYNWVPNSTTNDTDSATISNPVDNITPRYAAFGDGPKFICDIDYLMKSKSKKSSSTTTTTTTTSGSSSSGNSDSSCLVYNVGSNNEISFEKAVYEHIVWNTKNDDDNDSSQQDQQRCEIHTFDPTLSGEYIGYKYSKFHPWGFCTDNETVSYASGRIEFKTYSFDTVYNKMLNHTNRIIDIFKIDCEGCEFAVMVPIFDMIAQGKLQINQILIEMHSFGMTREKYHSQIIPFFEAADKAKMRLFHKERNHWGCQGSKCLEYALVSESYLRNSNKQWLC